MEDEVLDNREFEAFKIILPACLARSTAKSWISWRLRSVMMDAWFLMKMTANDPRYKNSESRAVAFPNTNDDTSTNQKSRPYLNSIPPWPHHLISVQSTHLSLYPIHPQSYDIFADCQGAMGCTSAIVFTCTSSTSL